jgi:hypothetical protein
MAPELVIVGIVFVGAALYAQARRTSVRLLNPLRIAFALTTLFIIYVGAALCGLVLPAHHLNSLHELKKVGYIVWPQAESGALFGLLSIPMWWVGLNRLRRG